jgi:HemN C-terminal domain
MRSQNPASIEDYIQLFVGQVENLRPGPEGAPNRPAGSTHNAGATPAPFAAWRYVGQAIQPAIPLSSGIKPGASPAAFEAALEAALSEERFFVGLRLTEGIRPAPEEWLRFADPIRRFIDSGLLETAGGMLRLTNRGVMLSNEVFQEFLTA